MARTLYEFLYSANCHKVRVLLSLLELPFETRHINLAQREHQEPAFHAVNPLRQVPVLDDNGLILRDSHAILIYLSDQYGGDMWLPTAASERALVLQWLFFDADMLHGGIGFARNYFTFGVGDNGEAARQRGITALKFLDDHLSRRQWLELGRPTVADIACAPLIEVAGEAGIDPLEFAHVSDWLARLRDLPGYSPMPGVPGR